MALACVNTHAQKHTHTRERVNAIIFPFFNRLRVYWQTRRFTLTGAFGRVDYARTRRHGDTSFSSAFHAAVPHPPVDSLQTYVRERFSRLLRLSAHLCSLCVQTRRGTRIFTPSGACTAASFVYIFHSRHTGKHLPAAVLPVSAHKRANIISSFFPGALVLFAREFTTHSCMNIHARARVFFFFFFIF